MNLSIQAFFNSIAVRVMAVLLGSAALALALVIAALQTPLSSPLFDRGLMENAQGIAELIQLLESTPQELEGLVLSGYEGVSRAVRIDAEFAPQLAPDPAKAELLKANLSAGETALADREMRFRTIYVWEMQRYFFPNDGPPISGASILNVAIELRDGRVLNIWLAPTISFMNRPFAALALFSFLITLAVALGFAVSSVITGPIRKLERDAELVGLAETAVPISETGPRELRRLSAAFNRMRARLSGLIREREEIVVAIAHDIRTGITRLKLRLEDHLEDEADMYEADLALMERLVTDMLTYARAESPLVDAELIDLTKLLPTMAQASPLAVSVHDETHSKPFVIAGSKLALHRLFENLIENARRYGDGAIGMRMAYAGDGLRVSIEDNGPGIPEAELERVFKPFTRGESSRNRETGGSGLGLGIARAIANTHGAQLSLHNREGGGLEARVFFPEELVT